MRYLRHRLLAELAVGVGVIEMFFHCKKCQFVESKKSLQKVYQFQHKGKASQVQEGIAGILKIME